MDTLSSLAETLIGSEIVRLGNEINARIAKGEQIYNFTIGDFNPNVFAIPQGLEDEIIKQYQNKKTNYPSAEGIMPLRESICNFLQHYLQLQYSPAEVQVASGGRPLIYSIFRVLVDKGDEVVYPVPSWNNNHYTHFNSGIHKAVATLPQHNFMPTPAELAPYITTARLIAVCSPLNPTGTIFSKQSLLEICQMIIAENELRKARGAKLLYLLYDQIYCLLQHGSSQHYHPVGLVPAMKDYTVYVDGISKSFAATGVRVGWSMGPAHVIAKVKAVLSHIGAWAPMAEQVACANYLSNYNAIDNYFATFKQALSDRLNGFHNGFQQLKSQGFAVDSIAPEAAMYLTVQLNLKGKSTAEGKPLTQQIDVWQYILDEAHVALVPFSSFGAYKESNWYRLSVGTCQISDIPVVINNIKAALEKLQ
jgi:aspartate aminotransferase